MGMRKNDSVEGTRIEKKLAIEAVGVEPVVIMKTAIEKDPVRPDFQ
jgi:hypothetical protein